MREDPTAARLRDASFPQPARELRDRVVAAAAPLVRPTVTWSDRFWFSRRWRLGMAAAFVAVVALDYAAGVSRAPVAAPPAIAQDTARAVEEVARRAGIPTDDAAVLSKRAFDAARRPGKREELSLLISRRSPSQRIEE